TPPATAGTARRARRADSKATRCLISVGAAMGTAVYVLALGWAYGGWKLRRPVRRSRGAPAAARAVCRADAGAAGLGVGRQRDQASRRHDGGSSEQGERAGQR